LDAPDKDRADRADATADVVGCLQLHEQVADIDTHHIASAQHRQRHQRQGEAARDTEDDRGDAERQHAAEHPAAHGPRDRHQ
jgi:hypothetical protein